ncbi:MAG: amidohydrolase family protein [Actinomycetota bacterium]|nr:amidohydrolase family protein [Actinomycetota bacterium]
MSTLFAADWVVPVSSAPVEAGAVLVEGERIAAVGPAAQLAAAHPGAGRVDLPGCVLAPGFVNLHSHIEYAAYAGLGDGLAFGPWIAAHTRRTGVLGPEGLDAMARLGAAECVRSGVTTLVDAAYDGASVRACTAAGLRAVVALEAFGGDDADVMAVADALERRLDALAAEAGPLVELAVSPHAPFTVGLPLFSEIVARARARELRVVTHLAESRHELDALIGGTGLLTRSVAPFGRHPIIELAERGLLGPETVVAHAVHVGGEEIAVLSATGVAVAHCPRSNALLGCGVAPLADLRAAGVHVGLGTDSPSSALSLDLFDELRAALFLARSSAGDPEALSTAAALQLATLDGARALGLADRGALEPGLLADLVAVRLDGTPFWPCDDPASALVLGGSPGLVTLVAIGGNVLYGVDSTAFERALPAAAHARSRLLDANTQTT